LGQNRAILAALHEGSLHFLAQLTAGYHRDPPYLILNFDESNCPLVMAGEETVHQNVDRDVKARFSFFAAIIA
jgi:hypothetical protein